jgi:hypothetical protein
LRGRFFGILSELREIFFHPVLLYFLPLLPPDVIKVNS